MESHFAHPRQHILYEKLNNGPSYLTRTMKMHSTSWLAACMIAAISIGGGAFTWDRLHDRIGMEVAKITTPRVDGPTPSSPAFALPFTFRNVVTAISSTYGLTPRYEEGSGTALFELVEPDGEGKPDHLMNIAVIDGAGRVTVTFSFSERVAMHYVAEFVECYLFTKMESEHIYELIDLADRTHSHVNLGRFYVTTSFVTEDNWEKLSFEFTPPRAFRG